MKDFLVQFLLRLTAVQCGYTVTYSSTSVCGLTGTSVVLPCQYDYPWQARGDTYQRGEWYEEGRGSIRGLSNFNYPNCSLNLDKISDADAGVYQFRFYTALHLGWITSTPGIKLSVTDLKVKEVALKQNQTEVTCSTSCSLGSDTEFFWYRNGQRLPGKCTVSIPPNTDVARYSCAVKGYEDQLSPALCVPYKQCWGVTYSYKNICVLMGTVVVIPCSYLHPKEDGIIQTFWFLNQKLKHLRLDQQFKKHIEYLFEEENSCTLRLKDIRETHSGEYAFRFTTKRGESYLGLPGVTISVTALQMLAPLDAVKEGDKVTLTCNTTCTLSNHPTFIWYKNGQPVTSKHTTRDNKLHLNPVSSEDGGNYSCAVRGLENLSSTAVFLSVRYKAKNVFVSIMPSTEIKEGSVVTLTCSSDSNPPVHNYTWYMRSGAESLVRGTGESISFNVTSDTSGLYYCEAQNEEGSQNSTEFAVQTGGDTILPAVITIFIILAVLLILGIVHLSRANTRSIADRRTAHTNVQSNSGLVCSIATLSVMTSDPTQGVSTCDQENVQYANIQNHRSKSQEVPLYSSVQTSCTSTASYIDYSSVKFLRGTAATRAKDDIVTYSAVHRP